MVSQIQNINAIIQFTPGEGKVWNDVAVAVPEGVWVLNTETNIIHVGDGVTLIGDLPIYWDLNQASDNQDPISMIPEGLESAPNKILTVNTTGDALKLSTINISEMVTLTDFSALMLTLANTLHTHGDIYYTKEEIQNMAAAMSSFNSYESDIISMLVLDSMDRDNETYKLLPNGVADEFEDTSKIAAATTAVYDSNSTSYELSGPLVTEPISADENVSKISVVTRCVLPTGSAAGVDVEVSRDGGSTFAVADSVQSNMKCGEFNFTSNIIEFDKSRVVTDIDLSAATIENMINIPVGFVCDVANTNGHFASALPVTNVIGAKLTVNGGSIIVTSVTGNGTTANSIQFSGTLAAGSGYTIDGVYKLKYDSSIIPITNNSAVMLPLVSGNTARAKASMVTIDDNLYIFGGYNGSTLYNDMWCYNITNATWTQLTSGATGRYGHTAVVINRKIYIFGGYNGTAHIKDLWVYDPTHEGGTPWTQLASGATIRYNHSAVAINNKMYIFGGYGGTAVLNDTWEYNPTNNTWTQKASGASIRTHHSAVAINNKMYIFGGANGTTYLNDTWVYDPTTNLWTQKASGASIRYHHTGSVIANKMYIYGGYSGTAIRNDVWMYDPDINIWTQKTFNAAARWQHSAAVFNSKIYIYGGVTISETTNSLLICDADITVSGLSTISINLSTTDLNSILVSGAEFDNAYAACLREGEYQIFKSNTWTTIVRDNSGTFEYLNNGVWTAASVNTAACAIREALSNSAYKVTLSDFTKNIFKDTNITTLFVVFDIMDNTALTATKVLSSVVTSFATGSSLVIKVTDYNDTPADLHGMRIRW